MTPASIGLGIAALLLTAVLWGSNHVVARAVHDMVPLPAMVFWRWALALVILLPIALPQMRRDHAPLRRNLREIALGGIIGVGIFSFLLVGGAYQSLAIEVGIINATTPAWVAVIAWLGGQSLLGPRGWMGLLLAFLGTVVIVAQGSLAVLATIDIRIGNLWSLLGAIAFAWFSLRVRAWSREISSLSLTAVTALIGCLAIMAPVYMIWLVLGGETIAFRDADTAHAWASVIYVALGPTLLGNVCYLFGVSVVGPQRAAAFLYLSPVFAALLSVALLGEPLHVFHLLGFVLIITGLVVVNLDR
ncbi:MAG: DMT family transporter [Hyphomicrobium sp.]|nr:DMT family transporter [Hyphomicrobium sp.]